MSSISALNSLLSSTSASTSGIDLSALLEAATGASAEGINVNAAVSSAISAAEAPEQSWKSQQTILQNQNTALTALQTDATNLDNDMQALNSITGPLSAVTVSSSNSSIVSATAASGSAVGTHVIQVSNLASTASWESDTVTNASTPLAAGSFTITGATGTVTPISTGTGTSTLGDVAATINSDNLGVTANVVNDANGARLEIVSNTSGSAANFTVLPATGGSLDFSQAVLGANASVKVDGIDLSSASNTVNGAIPGVTLNLLNASPGTNVSLTISPDTTQAATAINQFVTDYNTAVTALNAQFADTGSGEGPLAGDSVVRNLQSDLQSALSYVNTPASGTTTVSTLASLGISVGSTGTLTVDNATLYSALQNNFSDVQTFFQGTALNGFANALDQQLTNFTSPADGAFTVDLQSLNTQYNDLQTDITNFQTNYIAPLKTQLNSEYSKAEFLLQQLPTEMAQINQELGFNTKSTS
jgi:flagellar hook-associated protein 2